MRIRISWPSGSLEGELNDTPTAKLVYEALPIEKQANTWGEEVYFGVPVETTVEDGATDVVDPGVICYWVEGAALALPFGRTPASVEDECRLVAAVNQIGKIVGDPRELATVNYGDRVRVEPV